MSWLFSQALAEEYSAATCSDGGPCAPLSVMPTPHKFWRNDKTMEPSQLSRSDRSNDRLDHAVMASDGGQLNPEWVEWLMGWPIGWTDLKPLEMDKFREWQQQHSVSYPAQPPKIVGDN